MLPTVPSYPTDENYVSFLDQRLKEGDSLADVDPAGLMPLHRCALTGNMMGAQMALAAPGVAAGTPDEYGDTPLHYACFCGQARLVKLLLEFGADPSAEGEDGKTPFGVAVEEGHDDIVSLLVTYYRTEGLPIPEVEGFMHDDSDAESESGARSRELSGASFDGDLEAVYRMLEDGADPCRRDPDGNSPLHLACTNGSPHVVDLLVQCGADVRAKDAFGLTPMHYAALCGHDMIVAQLAEYGADVTEPSSDGVTPLDSARTEGHLAVVAYLTETYTKAGDLEFSNGVALEQDIRLKRPKGLFRWQRAYLVVSTSLRALFLWYGNGFTVKGRIFRINFRDITKIVQHPATKKGGRRVDVVYRGGALQQILCGTAEACLRTCDILRSAMQVGAQFDELDTRVKHMLDALAIVQPELVESGKASLRKRRMSGAARSARSLVPSPARRTAPTVSTSPGAASKRADSPGPGAGAGAGGSLAGSPSSPGLHVSTEPPTAAVRHGDGDRDGDDDDVVDAPSAHPRGRASSPSVVMGDGDDLGVDNPLHAALNGSPRSHSVPDRASSPLSSPRAKSPTAAAAPGESESKHAPLGRSRPAPGMDSPKERLFDTYKPNLLKKGSTGRSARGSFLRRNSTKLFVDSKS